MSHDSGIERFFEVLINGDRPTARLMVEKMRQDGATSADLVTDLFWPTYQLIDKLYRQDQLTKLCHHLATRLLRVLVDQSAVGLERSQSRGRTILAMCGASEGEELGAQMAVDLLEHAGFSITFAGGGIANDEILNLVNESKPDVLLAFASAATDLPNIRALIDSLREIGAAGNVQFAVGGGVFNRADGLAEEIGADLWATSPLEMVEMLVTEPQRRAEAEQRTVGRNRRKRMAA